MSTKNFTPIVNSDKRSNDASIWNDPMNELDAAIGNRTGLRTTRKQSLVAALNEVDRNLATAVSAVTEDAEVVISRGNYDVLYDRLNGIDALPGAARLAEGFLAGDTEFTLRTPAAIIPGQWVAVGVGLPMCELRQVASVADETVTVNLKAPRTSALISFNGNTITANNQEKIEGVQPAIDNSNFFRPFLGAQRIKVTGSNSNNGIYTVSATTGNTITVTASLTTEAIGAGVTLGEPFNHLHNGDEAVLILNESIAYPWFFGAVAGDASQAAANATAINRWAQSGAYHLRLTGGSYHVNNTVTLGYQVGVIEGDRSSRLICTDNTKDILVVQASHDFLTLWGVDTRHNSLGTGNGFVFTDENHNLTVEDCQNTNSNFGFYSASTSWLQRFVHCRANECHTGFYINGTGNGTTLVIDQCYANACPRGFRIATVDDIYLRTIAVDSASVYAVRLETIRRAMIHNLSLEGTVSANFNIIEIVGSNTRTVEIQGVKLHAFHISGTGDPIVYPTVYLIHNNDARHAQMTVSGVNDCPAVLKKFFLNTTTTTTGRLRFRLNRFPTIADGVVNTWIVSGGRVVDDDEVDRDWRHFPLTLANDAVYYMASVTAMVEVMNITARTIGVYMTRGSTNAVAECWKTGTFSTTKDTTGVNIYYDGSGPSGAGYYLQNRSGASVSLSVRISRAGTT
jgi:hypothetical protein